MSLGSCIRLLIIISSYVRERRECKHMKCPYCNKEIPDQAKFCGFCGNKISEDKKSETGKKDNNGNRNDKGNKHKKGKGLKILFGLILSVIIVVFVLFAMAVKRQMSINEEQKENTAPEEAYYKTFEKEEIRYENGILYVDSRLLLTAEEGIAYSEIEKKVQSVGGEIIGYIPLTGDYQIQFQEKDYAELEKLIGELKGTNEIAEATLENVIEMGFDSVDYETDPWISAAYPADRSGRSWSTFFPDGAKMEYSL